MRTYIIIPAADRVVMGDAFNTEFPTIPDPFRRALCANGETPVTHYILGIVMTPPQKSALQALMPGAIFEDLDIAANPAAAKQLIAAQGLARLSTEFLITDAAGEIVMSENGVPLISDP